MSPIPQYASTTNPDVLAAIKRNEDGQAEFHRRALAFAQAQGVEDGSYYPSRFGGGRSIRAVGGKTKPTTGRWKQGHGGYGWLPFKSNPIAAELDATVFDDEPVPGLPAVVYGPYNSDGGQHVATPRPFVVDGVAYVGVGFAPADDQPELDRAGDGGWTEIKASDWHKAAETFNERNAS